jgi:hypothetical protein
MPDLIPSEIFARWAYLPPALIVAALGLALAWGVGKLLNRTGLSRFFWHPPLAFLGFWVLASSLVGLFFLRP